MENLNTKVIEIAANSINENAKRLIFLLRTNGTDFFTMTDLAVTIERESMQIINLLKK